MRQRGFTLIELLTAMVISLTSIIIAVQLGRAWWTAQGEQQFFSAFERNWRHLMQQAQVEHVMVKVSWNYTLRRFRFVRYSKAKTAVVDLIVPTSIQVKPIRPLTDVIWHPSAHFTAIRTYQFRQASGHAVTFTSQLGWGELIREG